jgi:SAM-dependent MidA family methyltransferase
MASHSEAGDPDLLDAIVEEIRARGPLPFSRFMEISLYDRERGYYARGDAALGRDGDYFTASDVGTVLGACLARNLVEMDAALGHPDPFRIVELGAGRGLLARDLLDALDAEAPHLRARVRPVLVDRSAGMRSACARNVPEAEVREDAPTDAIDGCALAVELFDALPVRRLRREGGALREVLVDVDPGGRLVERTGDPGAELLAWAARYGAAPEEGDEAELAEGAEEQLERIQGTLARGFVLIVDYGYRAAELFGGAHRRGTLMAYHRHRASEDYLLRVGEQDLTAHVNFTALEERAKALSLEPLVLTTQDRFLIASGALDDVLGDATGERPDAASVRRGLQVRQLVHPGGMGRRFRVLLLAKGVGRSPRLSCLVDPFADPERTGRRE